MTKLLTRSQSPVERFWTGDSPKSWMKLLGTQGRANRRDFSTFRALASLVDIQCTKRRVRFLEEIENWGFNENASCLPSTLRRSNLKSQQSPFILALDLTRTRAGNSHGCCNYSFPKASLWKCFPPKWKQKPRVFKFLQSRDKLVWTGNRPSRIVWTPHKPAL